MRSKNDHINNDSVNDHDPFSGIGKKNNFLVPEGYFDELSFRLQKRLPPISPVNSIFDWIFRPRMVWIYSISLLLMISSVLYFNLQDSRTASIPVQAEDIEYIDEYMIAEQIDEGLLQDENQSDEHEEIENYLIENHIDNSLIINSLN